MCGKGRAELGAARAALFVCGLLAARCGSGTHTGSDAGATLDAALDATADATTSVDGGLPYDCEAACSREPPICLSDDPDHASCLDICIYFAQASGCEFGEGRRLVECLEETPGACEELPLGDCWSEHNCFRRCTDPESEFWCRPPAGGD